MFKPQNSLKKTNTFTSSFSKNEDFQYDVDINPPEFYEDQTIDSSYFSYKKSLTINFPEQLKQLRKSQITEEIDVLCVNCYECIPLSLVDTHSKYCISPQCEDEDTESAYINNRIKKIVDSIDSKIEKYPKEGILDQLKEIAVNSLESSANPYALLSKLDGMINSVSLQHDGISNAIIAKRLSNLIELKSPFYNSRLSEAEKYLKYYKEEPNFQEKETNRWMYRSEILMKLKEDSFPSRFYDISSDVGSDVEVLSISFSTGYSEFSDVDNFEDEEQVRENISNEQLKKHFYSICLKKKHQISNSHKANMISESELYMRCIDEDVPVSKWEEFIDQQIG